jgi:hypothetical protein
MFVRGKIFQPSLIFVDEPRLKPYSKLSDLAEKGLEHISLFVVDFFTIVVNMFFYLTLVFSN